ncbi:DUF465 domain-containing protein [Moraxella sp. FZLJ2107]|uniref:YdcH family protein n=1 Tax=unclassified Moraxella TaxID=2685852 RepID=UPI00209C2AB2|nr:MULTISPECIES: DUF465 domain-containing protein [unclassified Moraxella]USZ14050.1 DUF465 domain-containing protein [Moraxella sp. FZFQ2102]UTO04197.1 DUF465 domain-containing protein [Moraxella sp. FZLJ2107]UTO23030.1 DUF465 domain-containing protein [Moraxella sp. FZLJ2109]
MLPEYRELMTQLKAEGDAHFLKLFNEHNDLDTEIENLEKDPVASVSRANEIEEMKRQKLHLKDELKAYLETKA